jgi:hypothetical protein
VPRKIIGAGLSKKSVGKKDRRLLYLPLMLALVMLAVVYLLVVAPSASPHAAVDFTLKMSVQYNNPANQTETRFIAPRFPVGVSGGLWASHQYDGYGLDGHYPLYTELLSSNSYFLIHVRSTVAHNYTLGDFFAVWGFPLGENNTIGVVASNGSHWQLCIGLAPPGRPIISNWGQQVLVKDVTFFLIYYNPSLGAGCA